MDKQKPIYTEIRIRHKSKEEKGNFEAKLEKALKEKGYSGRVEWIKESYRELINGVDEDK